MSGVFLCEDCKEFHGQEESCPERSARILVVEDDASVLTVLVRTLALAGHEVVAASNGREAVHIFECSGPFDLLITDVVMPGCLQGQDVIQALRGLCTELPVIVLTGYLGDAALVEPNNSGKIVQLTKPVPGAALRALVGELVQL